MRGSEQLLDRIEREEGIDPVAERVSAPAARRLIGLGLLTAPAAALAGWSDWLDTAGAERRVGLVHAASNIVGLASYAVSWRQRRRGGSGLAASLAGATALGVGGWLGGHLAYALGVGVDTTAFQRGPTEWTDVLAASEVLHGPATRPQPVYEVRETAGRVELRRSEVRSLRANPVGPSTGRELRPARAGDQAALTTTEPHASQPV